MSSNDTIKKQVNHCTIAVSDWLAGGCDVNDIPRPEMNVLVAFQKEWLKDMAQTAQTPQAAKDNLTAFKQYLQECEDCLEVPDVAGAFNAGWQAMQKAALQERMLVDPAEYDDYGAAVQHNKVIGAAHKMGGAA
jgi:hypothetical protein